MTVNLCKWTILARLPLCSFSSKSHRNWSQSVLKWTNTTSCEVVMDFNSRMLCTCILDQMLYMETTSQVLVLRHSMVSVDPSRGGNYNVVTTSRLFFTQLSNILFQVVSEWQTQTCITWVITWSMEATNEFSPDPLTLWLYFAPWTVWIYVLGTLNKVLHSQTNSEIKELFRLLVLYQRAVV